MGFKQKSVAAALVVATIVAAVIGCDRNPTPAPPASTVQSAADYASTIRDRVTIDAMMTHLSKLQAIADANDGNRAVGTPGYEATADYVADALRAKGFDVQIPEFELRFPFADAPVVTVRGSTVTAKPLEYTFGTPPEGVTGPLLPARVEESPGCTATDYDGLPIAGAVVLVDRGQCPFGDKQAAAAQRGAVAMIVADTVDDDQSGATLGEQTDVKIPAVIVSKADGQRLRAQPGSTTIKLNAGVRTVRTRNVVAQTKTGSTHDVVAVGAHMDSVPAGPGINDDGSGVAAVLELALQMGSSPTDTQRRPVRLLGRRRSWTARLCELRAVAGPSAAQGHRAVSELRHARLAQPGVLHHGRRPVRAACTSAPAAAGARGLRRHRTNPGGLPRGCRQDRAGHLLRRALGLRRIHSRRDPGRRDLLRRRGLDDQRRGRAVGWNGGPAVRSELPPEDRHSWTASTGPRWASTAGVRPTPSRCTRRTLGAETGCPLGTTARGTCSRSREARHGLAR